MLPKTSTLSSSTSIDPNRAIQLAQKLLEILLPEDPTTRTRAVRAAFELLGEPSPELTFRKADTPEAADIDLASFFSREGNFKPADYVQLCAAYHFSKYGVVTFTIQELRSIAADAGVVLPDRIDMTLNQASNKGKKLFQSSARGVYRPTAMAGVLFKEKWGVKPGKLTKPQSDASNREPANAKA